MGFCKQFCKRAWRCNIQLLLVMVIVMACGTPLAAGSNALNFDAGWVMHTGDNPDWAKAEFDDSEWKAVEVGSPWEEAGYADYDGYAWYRIHVHIPQQWQERDRHGFFSLLVGAIDDVDQTFFNGQKIGATGSFPPDYKTAYYTPRRYRVPADLVRWGDDNLIAIRVYDGDGEGGLIRGPFSLRLPEMEDVIRISFQPISKDGLYFSSEPVSATVTINNFSSGDVSLTARFELLNDRVDSVQVYQSSEKALTIPAKSKVEEKIAFTAPGPGFYFIKCTINDSLHKKMLFGYEPEKIQTPLTRPADFQEFWAARKQELAAVPPEFKVSKSDESTDKLDIYLVEMQSYGHVTIRGWYTVPKSPGPHPAILSVPGYTSTMWPYVRRTNVATFALNPRGHGNSKDDVDPKGEELMFLGFDPQHPEKYIYAGIYMDCLRAVDFLVSRPEIDASRIGVEGGSQGGGLSFATAALDDRICFSAPDIPWLGDWVGYLQAEYWGWNNYPKLFEKYPDLTFAGVNRFLSYFDTMNMAEWIDCPVLMSVGLQDNVCPPRTSFAPFNAVRSEKEYRVYPFAGHGTWAQHWKLKNEWMAKKLGIDKIGEH